MTPTECATVERIFGIGCSVIIAIAALHYDGVEGMAIAGGCALAAAGVGSFVGARSSK